MIQAAESFTDTFGDFPDERPIFGPTPANEKYVDEFLLDYFGALEEAHPTMPDFVYHALKQCVDETAWMRKHQNTSSFDARRVKDLSAIDQSLVQGYFMGTNTFSDSLRLMEQAQTDSIEGKRYTPKPHLRDAFYPNMRAEAREEIRQYDPGATLHGAQISKHRPFAVYNIVPKTKTIDGFGDYIRLDHGYADSAQTVHIREKSHTVIRLDQASEIHNIAPLKHEKLIAELGRAFVTAAESAQLAWDTAHTEHFASLGYDTSQGEPHINPGEFAAQQSRHAFLDTYLDRTPMLRDMIEEAAQNEYEPLPRWIVPITTQLYAHRVAPGTTRPEA